MRHRGRALRRRYGHATDAAWAAFDSMGPVEYSAALHAALQAAVGDRQPNMRLDRSWGPGKEYEIYVNYINLPKGVGSAGGGAEAENNRASFWIRGFKADDVPVSKLRVEMSNSVFPRTLKMRTKTASQGAIAKYLTEFLGKIAREVPPKFTHTEPR